MVSRYQDILQLVNRFDPKNYASTRNYKSGSVSRLSPYISRGVISTRYVYDNLVQRFKDIKPFEKFVQELAWRDYWQRVWQKHDIDEDIAHHQDRMSHFDLPEAVLNASTGIEAVDEAIEELYETGYMHNHMRMYLASIVCNMGQYYWKEGARWMYAHLKDADWGSNALSWQWVAGSNSSKRYFANQENINKYFESDQSGTFLDRTYEELTKAYVPEVLQPEVPFVMDTNLPDAKAKIDDTLPTLLFTHYNLDPSWHDNLEANRVLILEPKHFENYPLAPKVMDFILEIATNIEGIQIHTGSFQSLQEKAGERIIFKEHPFFTHFEGEQESRDWLNAEVPLEKSFFRYWKELKKQLPELA